MFKKVDSLKEQEIFDEIWMKAWQEKGFCLENPIGFVCRYLVKNKENKEVGTLSFRPYTDKGSYMDEVFPFYKHPFIQEHDGHVVELDKVSILKEYRGKENLKRLIITIVEYAKMHDVHDYIAVIDEEFYNVLRLILKEAIIPLSDTIVFKGSPLVPAAIDMQYAFENIHKYRKLFGLKDVPFLFTSS